MRSWKLAAVLTAGLLLIGPAAAQPPGGGFGGGGFGRMPGGAAAMLSFNRQLQEELKMDKEQIDKLTEVMAKVREDLGDVFAKLRDASTEERAELVKKMVETNQKAVSSVLKPEQMKRLQQIDNQQAGLGMYSKEDVQKALKLSAEQKDKIQAINSELQKDIRDLGQGGRLDPQFQRKRQALEKEAAEGIQKILDDDQKKVVKDLTGEPFETRFGGGFGGGGGSFGGGGFGGIPQPGQIMSTFVQDQLKLTAEQKKQLEEAQKEVDAKLEKILTEEQRKQLKDMRQGFGRRPGPGGN